MFREMRRSRQALSLEESIEILKSATSGVLSVSGDDGYPYGVPMSFVYNDSKIFFHCAKDGHKLDAIKRCDKVSFCVTAQDHVVPQEYTTYFRSVIVFGRARILEQEQEKRTALEKLAARYSPEQTEGRLEEINKLFLQVRMVELTIEHITGKEAIELVRSKDKQNQQISDHM